MRIGIDTGGTFTDFVIFDPTNGKIETFKLSSTPDNPANAILAGLSKIAESEDRKIIHGSTVATNALLEGKGAKTALITTAGFEDVLQIRRQNRPDLYDLFLDPPEPLVPSECRLGVKERINAQGDVQENLTDDSIEEILKSIETKNIEAVAICLLFSFLYPEHEQRIATALKKAGYFTSVSSEILPEFREYERTSTTVVNAIVSPIMSGYLAQLENELPVNSIQVMQSNGGSISPAQARNQAVRCILSGPAGGVVGALEVGSQAGFQKLITFDMGGTSTDVSLIDGEFQFTHDAQIGGHPIHIPVIDIHTVGAGGGSIASLDAGGALRVGPESAGAVPGPACYGEGAAPTVTDANLVLGRLRPEYFMRGSIDLDPARSFVALRNLGDGIGISAQNAALGVIQIANAHMAGALRVISVTRGHDPLDYTMLSFGGAGGLHAVELARELGIKQVLIPPQAATLSALGMLMADVIKDFSQTVMLPGNTTHTEIRSICAPLISKGMEDLNNEGIPEKNCFIELVLDMRYIGQSYEINVPLETNFLHTFHNLHQTQYGYADPHASTEIVTVRVKAIGRIQSPKLPQYPHLKQDTQPEIIARFPVLFEQGELQTPFIDSNHLSPGDQIEGPAIVIKKDTTILIPPGDSAKVDEYLNLLIQVRPYEN